MTQRHLYLHIGTHKTATTAFQHFFASNRDRLAQRGIVYPCDLIGGGEAGHYRLAWAVQAEMGVVDHRFPADLRSSREEWDHVLKQCTLPNALISTEGFWDCRYEHIRKIRELVSDFSVKVVLYLRRQDHFEDSWYNQLVKDQRCLASRLTPGMFPVNPAFHNWVEVFGRESLVLRPFEKEQFYGQSVFSDFLHHALGLELTGDFKLPPQPCNPRLHAVALEYRRLLNHLPMTRRQKFATLTPLLQVSGMLNEQGRADQTALSPRGALELIRQNSSFYSELAREYLGRPEGPFYYEPLPSGDEPWHPCDLGKEDALLINGHLNKNWPELVPVITASIETALRSKDADVSNAARRLAPGLAVKAKKWFLSCLSYLRKSSHQVSQPYPRELFIHIGTGKTGTSALQAFFTMNRVLLTKKGIVYPLAKGRDAQNQLAWSLFDRPDPRLTTCAKEWRYVLSQLTAPCNLISAEEFSSLRRDAIAKVKGYVSGFRVKIVVYLRRRDSWQNAGYNQIVKKKGILSRPKISESRETVDGWSEVFGRENIIVRPYERGQFYRGTIFADFLHYVLGMELTDEFALPPKDVNTSLHRVALEYKRMVNHLPLSPHKKRTVGERLSEVSVHLRDAGRKDASAFSPAQRLEMIEQNSGFYARIAREHLGRSDGQLFYDPLPDPHEPWEPYDSLLQEDAILVNRYLCENCPDIVKMIRSGIKAAVKSDEPDVAEAARLLMPGIPEFDQQSRLRTASL